MKVLFISFVVGLGVGILYGLIRVKSPAPPIVALLGLLGMVIGEQFGVWVQTKKLDVSHAASVCLVGERYDRPRTSAARSIQAREDLPHAKQIFPSKND
jgi:XapX domain-containing protein